MRVALLLIFVCLPACLSIVCSGTLDRQVWSAARKAKAIPRDMYYDNVTTAGLACGGSTCNTGSSCCQLETDRSYYTSSQMAKIVGKVFFRLNNVDYVCSASILTSGNSNDLAITAGHCVYDIISSFFSSTKTWASSFVFDPGYYNADRIYGSYAASRLCTSDGFYANAWSDAGIPYDYAVAVFADGVLPTDSLTFAEPDPSTAVYQSYGYPQATPFNGRYINTCTSGCCTQSSFGGNHPDATGIGCDSTGGASGGPLILQGTDKVVGVNSFKFNNDPNQMFTPGFDGRTRTFVEDAQTVSP
eukprot:TRINITY_DN46_c0_g1_i1.p1 TRINITY_DN46_c0_g1~~TRINITY_DN46_c0_g1_i1.p1  ORF type:complete len:302 (-),score=42.28 TRINITY_DN46_c0_g1_i1:59-964(-)